MSKHYTRWPLVEAGHNVCTRKGTITLICPECWSELRPVKMLYQTSEYERWVFVCPDCELRCEEIVEPGKAQAMPVDERDEKIAMLEARVSRLEQMIAQLIQERKSPPPHPSHHDDRDRQTENAALTDRYAFLLKSK